VVFGAVGQLQFEVMQYRLKDEYGVEVLSTPLPYKCSAWLIGDPSSFEKGSTSLIVKDRSERVMVLFNSPWEKEYVIKNNPRHQLVDYMA